MLGIWFRSYLNGLEVFPTLFNLSLNLAIQSSWSEPHSAPGLVFADCIVSPSLAAKNIISLISILTSLVAQMVNRIWEGKNRNFYTYGPRRKEQWPHRRLTQTCPWVSRSLCRGVGCWWPAAGLGALSAAMLAWDCLKEVAIIFITSTIVWPQGNNREGTQSHLSTENWIKVLLSMVLPIRTRPSFPLSQSLLSGSFHKPLILLQKRADRMKTTITEN